MKERLKRLLAHIDKLHGAPNSRFNIPDYEPSGSDVTMAMQRLSWLYETYSRHIDLIASLEKEANWLADMAADSGSCLDHCCLQKAMGQFEYKKCVACWREAARNAVAKQRGTNNE